MVGGLLLFLFAASGGIDLGFLPLTIEERSWQLLLSAVGIVLLAAGVLLLADERDGQAQRLKRRPVGSTADYQIKMLRPNRFRRKMEVSGGYLNMPPEGSLRLFTATDDGRFRPQSVVKFDEQSRRWSGRVDLGPGPYYSVNVVVALVDGPGITLWDYFYQVGRKTDWEPVKGRFREYAVECDRFLVEGMIDD
jgi:hypothetical protein